MRRARRLSLVLALLAVALIVPTSAQATLGWQSGPLQETTGYNCITGDGEYLAGSFMSYLADPANPPTTGSVFYVSLSATGIGNTCAGIYAYPQLILPANVSLAISGAHPVQCFLKFPNGNSFVQDTSSDCPQNLSTGAQGYNLTFIGGNGFWPLPQGGTVEMHVPVTASMAGALTFQSYVQTADGEGNGTMAPSVLAIVNSAATPIVQQIGIEYASPSITSQTTITSGPAAGAVNVSIKGFIDNHSNAGSALAELGQPPTGAGANCTSPVSPSGIMSGFFDTAPVTLATGATNVNTQITGQFTTLFPGHNYCWRLKATIGATTYVGNWEPFITQGSKCCVDPTDVTKPAIPISNDPNCSATSGNGCSTSTCSAGNSCGAAQCNGGSCLNVFNPPATTPTTPVQPPATTTTTAPNAPPPPPQQKPSVKFKSASAALKGSIIVVATGLNVSCPAGGASCKVSLSAKIKKPKLTVGSAHLTIPAGQTLAITFHLSSKAKSLLAKLHKLTIGLTGSATAGSLSAAISKTIIVKNPPKKHHSHR
jgi:hypothetical protein